MATQEHQAPSDVLVEHFESLNGWAELVRRRFVAFDICPRTNSDLAGVVHTRHVGHLQVSRVSSGPQTLTRTRRMAAASDGQVFALGMVDNGTGYFEQDGRSCELSAGDFVLYETSRPLTWSFTGYWRFRAYMWPRESIALSEARTWELTGTKLDRTQGIGCILGSTLDSLTDAELGLSPQGAIRLANEVAELAIIAASETDQLERAREASPDLRLVQVFIESNLADPTLSPSSIAREFHMSTRTLHRLFARHGLSVAAWTKQRRLEACRRALASPDWRPVPITEIAGRFGFPTQPFFSREFAALYGLSPRQYRHQHGTLTPADMASIGRDPAAPCLGHGGDEGTCS